MDTENKQVKLKDILKEELYKGRKINDEISLIDISDKNIVPIIELKDLTSNNIDFKLDLRKFIKSVDVDVVKKVNKYLKVKEERFQLSLHNNKLLQAFIDDGTLLKNKPKFKVANSTYEQRYEYLKEEMDMDRSFESLVEIEKQNFERNYPNILDKKTILFSGYGNKLTYGIFNPTEEFPRIAVSENIFVAITKEKVLLAEYLCHQFKYNEEVTNQVEKFFLPTYSTRVDKYKIRIKKTQLENIVIKLPSLKDQEKIYSDFKDESVKRLLKDLEISIVQDNAVADFIAHTMGSPIDTIRTQIKLIKQTLDKLKLLDKVNDPLGKNSIKKTLRESLDCSLESCTRLTKLRYDTEIILSIKRLNKDREICNLMNLCKDIKKNTHKPDEFDFIILGDPEVNLNIHKNSFITVIECLLSNAKSHAWKNKEQKKFEIEIIHDTNNKIVNVICRNNGLPFPDNISKDDYGKLSVKSLSSKGHGIGGNAIAIFTKAHSGDYDIKRLGADQGTEIILKLKLN